MLVWDGESVVGRWRARTSELTGECHAVRGVLGAKVLICRPRDPGRVLVERFHDYLETSFLPGRTFTGPGGLQRPAAGVPPPRHPDSIACSGAARLRRR